MTAAPTRTGIRFDSHDIYRSQLDSLAALARTEADESVVMAALVRATMAVPGVDCSRVWMGGDPQDLYEAGCLGSSDAPHFKDRETTLCRQLIDAAYATKAQQSAIAWEHPAETDGQTADAPPALLMITPIQLRDQVFGIHFAAGAADSNREHETNLLEKMRQLVHAISPFLETQLISLRDEEHHFHVRLLEFCREIYADPSLPTTSSLLAHEYQRLFRADRVWVLLPYGRRFRVRAVSGIPGFQRRAEVVRRLEQLAARACRSQPSFEWIAGKTIAAAGHLAKPLDQYLDATHVAQLRIEAVAGTLNGEKSSGPPASRKPAAIIVCEWFQPVRPALQEDQWAAAKLHSHSAVKIAADWSRAPVALCLRRWRRQANVLRLLIRSLAIAAVSCVVCAASLKPIDFSIEAFGELQPVNQRHVFATSTGVVRELRVDTGEEVREGTPLLTLEDAELELEIRRVEGELQTTERRIAAIEASRLDQGALTQDSANQINSLAGDFSEQLQQKENLQQELELLKLRRQQMDIASPIAGQVVTWDLQRLLLRRPVTRGQRLMTVADTQGPWQVEMRVSDEDAHELCEALRANPSLPIEFIVVSKPGVVRSAQIRELSETVEIRSQGDQPSMLCIGELTGGETRFEAAGLGVRGRICCGKKPALFVGLHKLWRAIQVHLLFPWGF